MWSSACATPWNTLVQQLQRAGGPAELLAASFLDEPAPLKP